MQSGRRVLRLTDLRRARGPLHSAAGDAGRGAARRHADAGASARSSACALNATLPACSIGLRLLTGESRRRPPGRSADCPSRRSTPMRFKLPRACSLLLGLGLPLACGGAERHLFSDDPAAAGDFLQGETDSEPTTLTAASAVLTFPGRGTSGAAQPLGVGLGPET